MIENLKTSGFQTHRELTVDFDRHVTTIVGPSDVGKSSVVRQLRWVLLNRPNGTAFKTRSEDVEKVRVELGIDGTRIVRERGSSRNVYQVRGYTLKAFGADVPPKVAELANVTEDNFQSQHDPPFWLTLSPGQLAKALNEVVDLDLIDKAVAELNREARDAEAEARVVRSRLKSARKDVKRLKAVELEAAELGRVERLGAESAEIDERVTMLSTALQEARGARRRAVRLGSRVRSSELALRSLTKLSDGLESVRSRESRIRELIDRAAELESELKTFPDRLRRVESELSRIKVCETCGRPFPSP